MTFSRHYHGFSLVEVMFAIVILGIGIILVAAIFPLAIQQTRSNADDAAAAQLARDAMQIITTNTTADQYPDNNGVMQAFADITPLWNQVSPSLISATDPRYAWVPYFSKSTASGPVTIEILVVRRVLHNIYTTTDTIAATGELVPRGIQILDTNQQPDGTWTIQISKDQAGSYAAVAPDSYLVIRSGSGAVAGQILRTSAKLSETSDSVTWSLQNSDGLASGQTMGFGFAGVMGRDWADAATPPSKTSDPASAYDGPSQDLAVYTSILRPR
jgi:prepilin-type N-terminal cleavage/methylation domain-containing protein